MKTYKKVTYIEFDREMYEKQVFCTYIKELRWWDYDDTLKVDFMRRSDDGNFITMFSSMIATEINTDLVELREDVVCMDVETFWNKYEEELTGKWHDNNRVIF